MDYSFLDNIPRYLTELNRWVVFGKRPEQFIDSLTDEGKLDKVPYNSISGDGAMSNNPSTWSSFEQVVQTYEKGFYNGIGFMFAEGDNLVGIDLDHCLNSNLVPNEAAEEILSHFPNTYIEISPSGDGQTSLAWLLFLYETFVVKTSDTMGEC